MEGGDEWAKCLVGDVAPVARRPERLELSNEGSAHGGDAVGHGLDVPEPFLGQLRIAENGGDNASAKRRGVGVHRTHHLLELACNRLNEHR